MMLDAPWLCLFQLDTRCDVTQPHGVWGPCLRTLSSEGAANTWQISPNALLTPEA
jgi:hypothetical protein